MPPQRIDPKAQKEGRLLLAAQAYQRGQFTSIRRAALAYNISKDTLAKRLNGRVTRINAHANGLKLTSTEEEVLLQ
jgi:hypothetical protein